MGSFKREMEYKQAIGPAEKLVGWLEENGAGRVEICGSLRRKRPIVGDIDLVVLGSAIEFKPKLAALSWFKLLEPSLGTKTLWGIMEKNIQVNLYFVKEESWGAMVLFLTGSQCFNIAIRTVAKKMGYKLNQYGVWHGPVLIAGKEEVQIFAALGIKWVDPPQRNILKTDRNPSRILIPTA